ncbi:MAG TPA: hypothetical protein VK589_22520 [Chryseolinea sp.]|nr:hypothetical protein [Chryseolinea sp.]
MAKVPLSVQYIREVFEVADIDRVWNELERRFHFNVNAWKKEFEVIAANSDRFKDLQEVFLEYGKMHIEPLLNIILKRHRQPTWINLLTYVLKDKIDKRKNQDEFFKNRYVD